jgi:E3 ubiquitin-protein ligase SHPRH
VFLLSLGAAAAGLTLTRANHVFLLEPALDPAVEQQAVARVHRYGQDRAVTIVRLLVQGTVEPLVLKRSEERQELFQSTHAEQVRTVCR